MLSHRQGATESPVGLDASKRTIPLKERKVSIEGQEQILCIDYKIMFTLAQRTDVLPAKPRYRQDPGVPETLLSFLAPYLHAIKRICLEIIICNVDNFFGLTRCVV